MNPILLLADSPPLPLVLLAVGVAFGLLFAIGKVLGGKPAPPPESDDRAPRERPPLAPPERAQAPLPPPAPEASASQPDLQGEVAELLRAGKKIQAIKRYREETGLSLKQAKDAVDALEAGRTPPPPPSSPGSREPGPELLAEVAELLRAGKKINAIKRYREETGLNLKQAKDAVDALEAGGVPASGPSPAPSAGGDDEDIRDFLRAGKKIQAIKVYRERYGVGLKEAKDAVERM